MINREQVAQKMQQGGKLDISAQFDGVMIHGIAAEDRRQGGAELCGLCL